VTVGVVVAAGVILGVGVTAGVAVGVAVGHAVSSKAKHETQSGYVPFTISPPCQVYVL